MIIHWLLCLCFSQTWMACIWGLYRYIGNPMLADIAWGLGITMLAYIHVLFSYPLSPYTIFMLGLVSLWGFRLSFFLYWTRLRPHHLDKRYQALKKEDNFFQNYQIQGLLQNIIALPWYFIPQGAFTSFSIGAVMIAFCGLIIECTADYQLSYFKKHFKGVCQVGLWRLSRHPNYFGECLIWFGFALASISSPWSLTSLISPISLYFIMRFITGPLTEKTSIESKGKLYLDYQVQTPMILPNIYSLLRLNKSK